MEEDDYGPRELETNFDEMEYPTEMLAYGGGPENYSEQLAEYVEQVYGSGKLVPDIFGGGDEDEEITDKDLEIKDLTAKDSKTENSTAKDLKVDEILLTKESPKVVLLGADDILERPIETLSDFTGGSERKTRAKKEIKDSIKESAKKITKEPVKENISSVQSDVIIEDIFENMPEEKTSLSSENILMNDVLETSRI